MTILSVYSSHSTERPQRLIGWKQVRRVHSPSLTEGSSAPPLEAFLLLSTVFALDFRGTKPRMATGGWGNFTCGGGLHVERSSVNEEQPRSYSFVPSFIPSVLLLPRSCSYLLVCHSEDAFLQP